MQIESESTKPSIIRLYTKGPNSNASLRQRIVGMAHARSAAYFFYSAVAAVHVFFHRRDPHHSVLHWQASKPDSGGDGAGSDHGCPGNQSVWNSPTALRRPVCVQGGSTRSKRPTRTAGDRSLPQTGSKPHRRRRRRRRKDKSLDHWGPASDELRSIAEAESFQQRRRWWRTGRNIVNLSRSLPCTPFFPFFLVGGGVVKTTETMAVDHCHHDADACN